MSLVETNSNTDDGDEELADQHAEGTPDEQWATTNLLDTPEGDWCRAYVDQSEDERDQEGVLDGASRLQEWSRVVEDEVDTSPLLHHLERCTEDGLAQVRVRLEERALEAVCPSADPSAGGDELALVLLVGNDLGKLSLDKLAVCRLTTKTCKSLAGLLDATALDEVTGGVRQEEKATTKNDTPSELNADRDAVRAGTNAVPDAVVDAGRDEQTKSNAELVSSHERTAHLTWANLGHVEDDNGGLETDAETSDETASDDKAKSGRCNLEDNTYNTLDRAHLSGVEHDATYQLCRSGNP